MQKTIFLGLLALFALVESAPYPFRQEFRADIPYLTPRDYYAKFYGYQYPRVNLPKQVKVDELIKPYDKDFRPLVIDRRFPLWTVPVNPLGGEYEGTPKLFYPMYLPKLGNLTNVRDYIHKVSPFEYADKVDETVDHPHNKIRLIGYPFYSRFNGYEPVIEIIDDSERYAFEPIKPIAIKKIDEIKDHSAVETEEVHTEQEHTEA